MPGEVGHLQLCSPWGSVLYQSHADLFRKTLRNAQWHRCRHSSMALMGRCQPSVWPPPWHASLLGCVDLHERIDPRVGGWPQGRWKSVTDKVGAGWGDVGECVLGPGCGVLQTDRQEPHSTNGGAMAVPTSCRNFVAGTSRILWVIDGL